MDDFTKIVITGIIAGALAVCFKIYTESQQTKAAISKGFIQCPDPRSRNGTIWQQSCD